MQSKKIILNDGREVTLWLIENSGKYTLDKELASKNTLNENFQVFIIDGAPSDKCSNKQRTSIIEYYETSSIMMQEKIKSMINEDINKVELVYNIILESLINNTRKS